MAAGNHALSQNANLKNNHVNADKFFLAVAEKAGLDASNPELIKILSHTELNRIDIPDSFVGTIQQNLLSLDDAKANHPKIKGHYYAEAMQNVDRGLNDAYREAGFTDEEIAKFNEERSSTKRIPIVVAALRAKAEAATEEAKKNGGKTGNADALNQQINDLNSQLAALKGTLTAKEKEYNDNLASIKINSALGSKFAHKTIYDKLKPDVRELTLKTLLNQEIQDNGAQLVLDETTGGLKLIKKDGSNFFDENNKQMSVDDFINKAFTKADILLQNPASNPVTTGVQGEQRTGQPSTVEGSQQKNNYSHLFVDAKKATNNPAVV